MVQFERHSHAHDPIVSTSRRGSTTDAIVRFQPMEGETATLVAHAMVLWGESLTRPYTRFATGAGARHPPNVATLLNVSHAELQMLSSRLRVHNLADLVHAADEANP